MRIVFCRLAGGKEAQIRLGVEEAEAFCCLFRLCGCIWEGDSLLAISLQRKKLWWFAMSSEVAVGAGVAGAGKSGFV